MAASTGLMRVVYRSGGSPPAGLALLLKPRSSSVTEVTVTITDTVRFTSRQRTNTGSLASGRYRR